MHIRLHAQLLAIARREAGAALAEDVVQEAMLIAVEQGRLDLAKPDTSRWLCGVVRNRARMAVRTARRGLKRDTVWQGSRAPTDPVPPAASTEILDGLSPTLKTLAALVLTGHNRREIAYLLGVSDAALRQRIGALKRHLKTKGLAAPTELSGLYLDLAYGRIRDALLPALVRHGGAFASHDPDGHLFVVRRSQNRDSRQ